MKTKVKAIVNGVVKNTGKKFEHQLLFNLILPEDDKHYGTGCYMSVLFLDSNRDDYVDVRYAGTKDLITLAAKYIENHWGENLTGFSLE